MPRPRKQIDVVYEDPGEEASVPKIVEELKEKQRKLASKPPRAQSSELWPLKINDCFISETGHQVLVVEVGDDEVTFGFTRSCKDEEERRIRTVTRENLRFFLKAYTRQ